MQCAQILQDVTLGVNYDSVTENMHSCRTANRGEAHGVGNLFSFCHGLIKYHDQGVKAVKVNRFLLKYLHRMLKTTAVHCLLDQYLQNLSNIFSSLRLTAMQ